MSKNSTVSKIWAFAISYGSLVAYLSTQSNANLKTSLLVAAPFTLFIYFTVGLWFVAPIVEKILDSIDRANYQKQSQRNEIASRYDEENEYQRNQQRRYDEKRRDLELEFEHTKKLMELQGSMDQGKLNILRSMQDQLKTNKHADLAALKSQIEAMKRG